MSKDKSDIYKASIGAPDNFMSYYYYSEFRKIDETQRNQRLKGRSSRAEKLASRRGQNRHASEVNLDNVVTRFIARVIGWLFLAYGVIGMSAYIILGIVDWVKGWFSAIL